MFSQRLSTWPGADHSTIVKDLLSGREHILPLGEHGIQPYPCQTRSACHFAGLNFVRVWFKHMLRVRGSPSPNPCLARWLSVITEHRVLEDLLSPCAQLDGEQVIQLDDMRRVPLFDGALKHIATQHGPPSTILFKQALRHMQTQPSPVSAMVVSRSASTTVCLTLRQHTQHVFGVLDVSRAQPERATLALVVNTSLEQTAARLSGVLPVDNRLMTRDRQWQAQLFTNCTLALFAPGDGVMLSPRAEALALNESVALLRAMGGSDTPMDPHRERHRISGPRQTDRWDEARWDVGSMAPTRNRVLAGRASGGSLRARLVQQPPLETPTPYEQTRRHCRIFFQDGESSSSASLSPSPISSEASDDGAYVECMVCFESIPEEEGIQLVPCAHGFCQGCLGGHVRSKIEARKYPVFCPVCMTERENASPSVVSGALVQKLGVSEAQYVIWSELEMAHISVRIHCRRCARSALVDREDYEQLEYVSCPFPRCRHTWCKRCQRSVSGTGPTHSCDGTQELDYLVKQMGWKYCPNCKTPVQKNGGCNHMTCVSPGCNTHFCYRCGKHITKASIPFLVTSAVNEHFKKCTL